MTIDIDSREGITEHLKDLGTFNELVRARHQAWYVDKRRLQAWVILGRFELDVCGNTLVLCEGAPADAYAFTGKYDFKQVMTRDETWNFTQRWSSTIAYIPSVMDRCPRCGEGWTLKNVHDVFNPREKPIMHRECRTMEVIQRHWEQLNKIADAVGILGERIMIPTEYFPDPHYFGPWMIVDTPKGPLKFGWRKRVINISWKGSKFEVPPGTFESEGVTVGEDYVHAYSEAKAVEYLTKIWST